MKIISIYILILIIPCYAGAQKNLVIKGTAPFLKNGTEISLVQVLPPRSSQLPLQILTTLNKHTFSFTLKNGGGEYYNLYANGKRADFLLGPGIANILINDSLLREVTIKDNLASKEYDEYYAHFTADSLIKRYNRARNDHNLYINNKNHDTAVEKIKLKIRDSLLPESTKQRIYLVVNWIKNHPNSFINSKILYDQLQYIPDSTLKDTFLEIPAAVRNNNWGKKINYIINNLMIGAKAPIFSQGDVNGKQIDLSSFRGKYVLIDFWASWCKPCRDEYPMLIEIMNKFKNRNFTILGISLDDKKTNWEQAIKEDKLSWTQLSDLKGFKNLVAVKYEIFSIPSIFLLSPEGKIVAKNIYGEELKQTIENFLKQP